MCKCVQMAQWFYLFVCTLHYLISIIMQTHLKVLDFLITCLIHSRECVSKIKSIFSIIFYSMCMTVMFNVRSVLYLDIIIKLEVWPICYCLGLGLEKMVCGPYLFISSWYYIQHCNDNIRIYIRQWTHKRHPISCPPRHAMGSRLWKFERKFTNCTAL